MIRTLPMAGTQSRINSKKQFLVLLSLLCQCFTQSFAQQQPVDYVNPYMGNISHLLVPTYPTVHLPNSLLRVYPMREDYTSNQLRGLPIVVPRHRGGSAFSLSPFQGDQAPARRGMTYGYDNEIVKPYYYQVDLVDDDMQVRFAPSHQSAIYQIRFSGPGMPHLLINSRRGGLKADENSLSGYQSLGDDTKAYIYLETDVKPINASTSAVGEGASTVFSFPAGTKQVGIRYGISYISADQAKKNLQREISDYDVEALAQKGREIWNKSLGKIQVEGDDQNDKTVFYTSLYRVYERMVCISEDGKYYSAFDHEVHDDGGIPFYTDDWIWDTYRAAHPLRVLIDPDVETAMLNSYIRMSEQDTEHWLPTFPSVSGDSHGMNSNHGVAILADAYSKGLRGFDLAKGYEAGRKAITEKTLAPWSASKAGSLDEFFKKNGYFPALANGETETVPEISGGEKRQPVAVTLGTAYDQWCLSRLAKDLGNEKDYQYFGKRSLDYHRIFNDTTKFFHPKDANGNFIEPFDYRFSGGQGARDAYDENNGWVYRWDVQHNISDLVGMIGGNQAFVDALEEMYSTSLGKSKFDFYAQLPDHTGNVGQFSMANEPSLHIPYLYNYAGQPWRTQKRVRSLLKQWFRNDLFGVPGDEDGGGTSAFVVFSSLGFYPVTPGLPMYVIGSPVFRRARIQLGPGKTFEVECQNYSPDNKYIQSASLDGKTLNRSWFSHEELMRGGKLVFVMGRLPNKQWASGAGDIPPSFEMPMAK